MRPESMSRSVHGGVASESDSDDTALDSGFLNRMSIQDPCAKLSEKKSKPSVCSHLIMRIELQ